MGRKFIFIFIFCFLTALLQAIPCSGLESVTNKGGQKTLTITQEDNGKSMTVKLGDKIRIELKELGSAGYGWYFENLDKEHLELVLKETKVISEGKVGASVMAVWLFETKKEGSSEIKMDYYRNWEGIEKAAERFRVKVTVE